jgi:hypothetical protein
VCLNCETVRTRDASRWPDFVELPRINFEPTTNTRTMKTIFWMPLLLATVTVAQSQVTTQPTQPVPTTPQGQVRPQPRQVLPGRPVVAPRQAYPGYVPGTAPRVSGAGGAYLTNHFSFNPAFSNALQNSTATLGDVQGLLAGLQGNIEQILPVVSSLTSGSAGVDPNTGLPVQLMNNVANGQNPQAFV